jgi:hypothetical protein
MLDGMMFRWSLIVFYNVNKNINISDKEDNTCCPHSQESIVALKFNKIGRSEPQTLQSRTRSHNAAEPVYTYTAEPLHYSMVTTIG